jgi:hypothetical protein
VLEGEERRDELLDRPLPEAAGGDQECRERPVGAVLLEDVEAGEEMRGLAERGEGLGADAEGAGGSRNRAN